MTCLNAISLLPPAIFTGAKESTRATSAIFDVCSRLDEHLCGLVTVDKSKLQLINQKATRMVSLPQSPTLYSGKGKRN